VNQVLRCEGKSRRGHFERREQLHVRTCTEVFARLCQFPPHGDERNLYVPSEKSEKKDQQPLRSVGVRLRRKQGELFGDGTAVKHFAEVSNLWKWPTPRLLEGHREKAGTIEMVHDILKNDLAVGVLHCGCFGAQRDDGAKAAGAAAGVAVGATESSALLDH
jgi:hypothetical protein